MGERLGFAHDAVVASHLQNATLMEGERAKATLAKAAAVARYGETHFGKRGDAARLVVVGVPMARVGKFGNLVHLLRGQRCRRRVLHHEDTVGVGLHQALPGDGVHILLLDVKALGVGEPVAVELIPAWEQTVIVHGIECPLATCAIDRAVDIGDLIDGQTGIEGVGNLDDGMLAHAINEQVGSGVEQYRAFEFILPIVVVRKAS